MKKRPDRVRPVHPGDFLRDDFMKPLELTAAAVARAIGARPMAVNDIIRHKRGVSPAMALKLGRLFSVPPDLLIGIQADYDLEVARDRPNQKFASI